MNTYLPLQIFLYFFTLGQFGTTTIERYECSIKVVTFLFQGFHIFLSNLRKPYGYDHKLIICVHHLNKELLIIVSDRQVNPLIVSKIHYLYVEGKSLRKLLTRFQVVFKIMMVVIRLYLDVKFQVKYP